MAKNVDFAALTQAGLNLIQQALSIYDSDLRLVVANRRFQEMFDLPDAMVQPGARFDETIDFLVGRGEYGALDDPAQFTRDRVEQALTFVPHYTERTRANGRVISIEGSPLPQGGWIAVYTDITGIKRQESLLRARSEELSEQVLAHTEELARTNRELAATNAALEETSHQLAEMESRTRLTTEMMPAHIARLDMDLCYTFSNRKLGAVIPGRPESIVGLHARDALGAEAYGKILPSLERARSGISSVLELSHQGSGRRIRVAFTPDLDDKGAVRGVYILSMDITEEAQAREALNQTRKRELAAQLTSGLAHDFSNLLTIILGMQARLGQMDLPDRAAKLVQATTGAARRGGVLLDRIASITGRREIHPEPTSVPAILAELRTLATPTLPTKVALEIKVSDLADPVMLDPGAIQDMILNLILNARDAIGDAPGKICIQARPIRETWLEISVSDTGPGFSDAALEQALNPFFTTKGGEGSGLGLSMVYDQTKLAGGQVWLENMDKGGARVTLRLPLRHAVSQLAPRLILLVEDTDEIRESVREMLVAEGHQVIEAASADEAIDLAGIDGIGLILSDINLGGDMSGPDLLGHLRDHGHTAPACLMTSLPPRDPRRAQAGFPVLAKPFSQAELAVFLAQELSP
ncbi:MAG TPA: response regulator [Aliiroseovarius sp.]|nr:response regulator [Aliiroseovarius sp.]